MKDDDAYRQIASILDGDPSIGRKTLSELTGYSEKVCRKRKQWYIESEIAKQNSKPLPPVNTNPDVTTYAILNDTHIPFQHNPALTIFNTIARLVNPDVFLLDGDIGDFYEISKFLKFKTCILESEASDVRQFLRSLRARFPASKMVYIYGNHEHRWLMYLKKNAPAIADNPKFTLASYLELSQLNIQHVYSGQPENYYAVPGTNYYVGHFNKVSKFSCYTAKNLIEDKNVNLIQAHTHRMGTYYKTTLGGDLVGYENGCLRTRVGTEYANDPNWQLGFSLMYVWADGRVHVDPYYIQETPNSYFTMHDNMEISVGKC